MSKRFLSALLCACLLFTMVISLAACNTDHSESDPTDKPTDKLTEAPTRPTASATNKPTSSNKDTEKEEDILKNPDVTKFNLTKYLYPIWKGTTSYAEAAFVREAENGHVAPIKMLYPIEEIVSVRSADLATEYVYGTDYYVDDEGCLCIIEDGNIPVLKYEDYYFELSAEEHKANNLATKFPEANNAGWGYIRAEIGSGKPGMSAWTLAVTYTHSEDSIVTAPADKSEKFEEFLYKLQAGEDITMVSTGDSITDGWSASGKPTVHIAPYCPPYNTLVENFIKKTFDVKIKHYNVGVSGSNTDGGVGKLDEICQKDPDLVLIAFGMNDGCSKDPLDYINNINKMVSTIEEKCPDACIVVVGTCLPNAEVAWSPGGQSILKYHIDYIDVLKAAEESWNNAAHADVTTANVEMFERKVYQDVTGSNSNHPNYYMHRISAQIILNTIFGDYSEW